MRLFSFASRWCVILSLCSILIACGKRENQQTSAPPPSSPAPAQNAAPQSKTPTCKFAGIDQKKDATVWEGVTAAFRRELQSDEHGTGSDANATPDIYGFRRVVLMAGCGDAIIVALEKSPDKKTEGTNRLVELYNFNLASEGKSIIEAKWPFWLWKLRKFAHFDDSTVPDIVFESASCTECEPEFILSSLRYDASAAKWELRRWPEGGQGISIADTSVDVDGSVEEYQTLSGIADFEHLGHDEIAVWTRYRGIDDKDPKRKLPAVSTLRLYRYQNGAPIERDIKDEAEKNRIRDLLRRMNAQQKPNKLARPLTGGA